MGDVVPFRKSRRWTRPEDYGHQSDPPPRKPEPPRRGKGKRWLRPWMFWLVVFLGTSFWVGSDPVLFEPPALLATEPEHVTGEFTRCGRGRGENCVIDGDTFRLGDRTIRLIGIDAPETHPARCEAEAKAGEAATAELQRLLNAGPFVMVSRIDEPTDRYGRELRAVRRALPDGTTQVIAEEMIASGTVRAYRGAFRAGWCGNDKDGTDDS